ncbi:protein rot1 [Zymoseptoria brevis]|uniref:Protein ROT1 n=1 Tax=Zymoseptoria brevis TaxID=1047168 RepID=A0A0F4G6V3_9PEZI|nr:protein rot1 [Zymoseptoria brevis]
MLLYYSLAIGLSAFSFSSAQTYPADLVGTWSTKSNMTVTGPNFYDAAKDELIEPARTGISYSFTADGHFEEAYYRAISNPSNPKCPSGIMQWQHGSWVMNANGSLSLTPIAVDGRQLLSDPCVGDHGVYTRYNQTELFKQYQVLTDPYHKVPRLNLFEFDGTPMQPMYKISITPTMLPTTTLHALTTATATAGSKLKRGLGADVPLSWSSNGKQNEHMIHRINSDRVFWVGLTFTGIGGLLFFGPRRLGIRL